MAKLTIERWRIEPASCICGGNIAWMRQRGSGAWEMVGCVCHSTPPELVGVELVAGIYETEVV